MSDKPKQVIVLDWPSDVQIITEALRRERRVLVPEADNPQVLHVVRLLSRDDFRVAEMNARVYAMSKADAERWYAEHPVEEVQ